MTAVTDPERRVKHRWLRFSMRKLVLANRIADASHQLLVLVLFVMALALLYCGLWAATQVVGTEHVKQTLAAQGSILGDYAYSPAPFVVSVDEIYYQPLSGQMQRADNNYGWAFGGVIELGASYVTLAD